MIALKSLFMVLTTTLVMAIPLNVMAMTPRATLEASVSPGLKTTPALVERQTNLRARADREIDRRVGALNELIKRLGTLKHLSSDILASLTAKVQTEITALTDLKTKIDVETDNTILKTEVQSIVTSYRVYLVFLPQIRILAAADSIQQAADRLAALAAKLATRVTPDQSELQTALSDMNNMVSDAKAQAQKAEQTVINLTPEGYPANKADLQSAHTMIKTAINDLKVARADAETIVKVLSTSYSPLPK